MALIARRPTPEGEMGVVFFVNLSLKFKCGRMGSAVLGALRKMALTKGQKNWNKVKGLFLYLFF